MTEKFISTAYVALERTKTCEERRNFGFGPKIVIPGSQKEGRKDSQPCPTAAAAALAFLVLVVVAGKGENRIQFGAAAAVTTHTHTHEIRKSGPSRLEGENL